MTPAAFERARRERSRAGARVPRRARRLPAGDLGLPVAHAGLPLVDRDRRRPGRAPHPAARLVAPQRAAHRRVRLLVRRVRAAGLSQSLTDTIFNMNAHHLSKDAVTVYEALEDAGLVAAAVNITCYRGRTATCRRCRGVTRRHTGRSDSSTTASSSPTRRARRSPCATAPPARSTRTPPPSGAGSSRATASTSSRTTSPTSTSRRTQHGPEGAEATRARADRRAIQALLDAAGGPDEFLERYAVILHSDHGQTRSSGRRGSSSRSRARRRDRRHRVEPRRPGLSPARRARRRGGACAAARRLPSVDVSLRREGDEVVAARADGNRRFRSRRAASIPTPPWRGTLGARESERRRAARLGGRGLGVRPISAAGTTRAAAVTARSSPATRSCRS